ncbi:MAG: serine/threonine-protein kinase [Thermodesulfovibrionales bacterium]
MTHAPPKHIGKYEIVGKLGQGGMGVVYLGHDPYNNRPVAIKVAAEGDHYDEECRKKYRKLFFNEARIAGMLDHPNILAVHDAGIDDGHYYLVMEYVAGSRTLKECCRVENLLPVERVVEIVFKCCKALDYAHRLGVIHRDIKPGNLMLTGDIEVKIGDFGIAQTIRADETQTQIMGLMGSPSYMSPEQVKEEPLTCQTDLFSLGAVMYELLTGRSPFHASTFSSIIRKVLYHDPEPLRFYRSDIPKPLEVIVMKALSKKISERYKTGTHFASDLRLTSITINYTEVELNHRERFTVLRSLDFFREFHDSEIREVLNVISWREFPPDRRIITEGNIDNTFYIIVSGEAAVRRGEKEAALLKKGDCFGEIGYLTGAKRASDIVSVSDVVLLEVNDTVIEQISPACQLRFHKVFLNKLIGRLSQSAEGLLEG